MKKCLPNQVLTNIREINEYVNVRKHLKTIPNVKRLIQLIPRYYQTLLYYLDHSKDKYIIIINRKTYRLEIGGHDQYGNRVVKSLPEVGESLLKNIFSDIQNHMTINDFNDLLLELNRVINSKLIPFEHKIHITNHESSITKNRWEDLIRYANPIIALESLEARRNLIFPIISGESIKDFSLIDSEENIQNLNNAYIMYTNAIAKAHISDNHFSDIFTFLMNELEVLTKIEQNKYIDKNKILNNLFSHLIGYNHLFHLYPWDSIKDLLDTHSSFISKTAINELKTLCDTNLSNFELGKFEIDTPDTVFANAEIEIRTVINFVIPYKMNGEQATIELNDGIVVSFTPITNLFDDPIFSFLDSTNINLSGIPLSFLSDSLGVINSSTLLTIIIPKLFNPDFNIIDKHVVYKDLSLENAQHGGKYYPHKDFIVELLHQIHSDSGFPFEIELDNLNSRLISNYMVNYLDSDGALIHQKIYTITNIDSYLSIKDRFLSALTNYQVFDFTNDFHEFFHTTSISSPRSLLDFCYRLVVLTLKKSIELGNLHKPLWIEKDGAPLPLNETQVHPIIFNQLRYLCEAKGVFLSREIFAADGSVDFHFFYTHLGKPLKVCLEVKNAHHLGLQHGLTTQLPLYINDVGNKQGIYLILWYKCSVFPDPKQYDSMQELEDSLKKLKPKKYDIYLLSIDCTPKISPSISAANKRLEQTY